MISRFILHAVSGRTAAALCAVSALLSVGPARADPASDEANRQNMMAEMRASAAANDRANFDSAQRDQANYDRAHSGSSGGGAASGSGGGGGSGSAGYGSPGPRPSTGPQSIVASYSFVIHRQESPAAMISRLEQEAGAGNGLSAFNLGRIAYTGFDGEARDDAVARRWFGDAAKLGHPGGNRSLAIWCTMARVARRTPPPGWIG